MLFVSIVPDVQQLGQGVFIGAVAPGPHVVPINATGHGWVEITGEVLPWGLSIHALTPAQLAMFIQTLVLPRSDTDCDNPTALVQAAATHVVLHNQDLTDFYTCQVRATYFTVTQPFAWLLFPGRG